MKLALSASALLVAAVVATFVLVAALGSSSVDITDLEVGDCFDFDADEDGNVDLVETIACDEPHNAEVVAVADLNPDGVASYPEDPVLFDLADTSCLGIEPDPRFGIVPVAPTEATWEARRGRVVCVALVYGNAQVSDRFGAPPRA